MGLDSELIQALRKFNTGYITTFPAVVQSINEAAKTISIIDIDELQFDDVRLAAAEDDKKSILVYPKIGSTVLVSMIGDDINTLYVSKVNEVEKVAGEIESVKFKIDQNGYVIEKGSESLKTILNDLIDEILKVKVIQGRTVNIPAVTAIKNRLNTVLK